MSTGPEHYREAERLLAEVSRGYTEGPTMSYQQETCALAEAQAHATLALAAAQAGQTLGQHGVPSKAWQEASQ